MKQRLSLALDSVLSKVLRGDKVAMKQQAPRDGLLHLPGSYLGQAETFSQQKPLIRHYSMVKDQGGGLTMWVYCPDLDSRPHEDESVVHVEELVEYCENRGLDPKEILRSLKALNHDWARQFKKRYCQQRFV